MSKDRESNKGQGLMNKVSAWVQKQRDQIVKDWRKIYPEGDGKAEKRKRHETRLRGLVFFLLPVLLLFHFVVRSAFIEEDFAWPYSPLETASEVSYSEISKEFAKNGEGRRIAIIGSTILVEMFEGAGDVPQPAFVPAPQVAPEDRAFGKDTPAKPFHWVVKTKIPSFHDTLLTDRILGQIDDRYEVSFPSSQKTRSLSDHLSFVMQLFLLMILVMLVTRTSGLGGGSFGTEKGFDLVETEDLKEGLADVAGIENARSEAEEIIGFLKSPEKFTAAGATMPKGALFDGPPGTGKTLLARAMAKEAGVTFIKVDASSLNQMFVGLGSMKVRKLFRLARKNAPCIVFIDEIDAMGGKRGNGNGRGGDQEREQTLNALLTELDGIEANENVFVIAATNRKDMLDDALVRPGRIDIKLTLGLPDIKSREKILKVHVKNLKLDQSVDLFQIAAGAYGASGATLALLVNEAAREAARHGRDFLTMEDFARARDKNLLPGQGGQTLLSNDERWLTAIHEAGHAVTALLCDHADPVEKITISPQGGAAGFVLQVPDRDRAFETLARLKSRLRVAVGGREAERIAFTDDFVTTGAASDIQQATRIAREMVMTYGMSPLGFMAIDPQDSALMDLSNPPVRYIRDLIEEAQTDTEALLRSRMNGLYAIANRLMQVETISGSEGLSILQATPEYHDPQPVEA